jgi:hypothetical protein
MTHLTERQVGQDWTFDGCPRPARATVNFRPHTLPDVDHNNWYVRFSSKDLRRTPHALISGSETSVPLDRKCHELVLGFGQIAPGICLHD